MRRATRRRSTPPAMRDTARVVVVDVAIELRARPEALGDVELAPGVDQRVEGARPGPRCDERQDRACESDPARIRAVTAEHRPHHTVERAVDIAVCDPYIVPTWSDLGAACNQVKKS